MCEWYQQCSMELRDTERSRVKMLEKKFCVDRVMRIEKVLKMASRTVDKSH